MKKIYSFILAVLLIALSGCSSTNTVLDICEYQVYCSNIPQNREIEFCLTDLSDYRNNNVILLDSEKITASENAFGYTMYKYYPKALEDKIKDHYCVESLDDEFGQPIIYSEHERISAILYHSYNDSSQFTLIFSDGKDYNKVDFTSDCLIHTMQIGENAIYLFSRDGNKKTSDIVVTTISDSNSFFEQGSDYEMNCTKRTIPLSAMGLTEINDTIYRDNIFISNDVLYFSYNRYGDYSVLAVCDLATMQGTNIVINDITTEGKLFLYQDEIGLLVRKGTDMFIDYFSFDKKRMLLEQASSVAIVLPDTGKGIAYSFDIFGNDFYCIGDYLCGFLYEDGNKKENMAYVQLSLSTGKSDTFISVRNLNSENYAAWGYIIRDGGVCPQQYGEDY